ncbi:hypothetical protein HK103_005806 [Boothiomyces macroporosus]|uniref:Calnexin n=1 Tax=Boothiomyces macroporosus TaxID=261099 RepID=A0AAD5UHT2_9FUNG|nr:hypothetical protein HK103_005806 [Boothiomyces macroporosus]
MKFQILALSTLALANEASEQSEQIIFQKTSIKAPFLEQFDGEWEKRWFPSSAKKIVDGVEDDELLRYRGEWDVEEPKTQLIVGDKGLVLKTLAAHSAIAAKFDKPVDPKGKTLVVQYEVKTQNGLECGGAYLKLLTHNPDFEAGKFEDKTPYTIMFGPDKCGLNNKVHFIFRHKNPVSGEIEEKHLESPPSIVSDDKTNLYTLIVRPDQTFEILINNKSEKAGSLLENFQPPVNPPKEIDDPNDKKPTDWVDEAKIKDPEAKKPDDWDEDAPKEIQPEDWLADEPLVIPDPESTKPEDWDDEEDGDWVAPTIPNPKCAEVSGCGKWSPPIIKNPKYKGKWTAPLIDNPAYKGEWAPRKIANPNYFEDKSPADFNKIGAIGFELWSMQNGFLFDNIYVGHSEEDAKALAKESWEIKQSLEKKNDKAEEDQSAFAQASAGLYKQLKGYVDLYYGQTLDFIEIAKEDPVTAIKELPQIVVLLTLIAMTPVLLISFLYALFTGSPQPKKSSKKDEKEEDKETKVEKKDDNETETKPKKRAPKKD